MAFTLDKLTGRPNNASKFAIALLMCGAPYSLAYGYDLNTEIFGTGDFPVSVTWPKRVTDYLFVSDVVLGQPGRCMECGATFSLHARHSMGDAYDLWRLYDSGGGGCIPVTGPGTLQSAMQRLWTTHVMGRAVPYRGRGFGDLDRGRSISWSVPICKASSTGKWRGVLHYSTRLSDEGTRSCAVSAPYVVELGNTTVNVSKTVDLDVVCLGDGDWDVRVSVAGPTTVSPTDGLTLWTEPPRGPIRVEGDGRHYTVQAKFGATVTSPRAGPYSTSFTYTIEYD